MNRKEKVELLNLLTERDRRKSRTKIYRMYPEEGPLRRELYVPHRKFFEAGAKWRERAMISGNRTGKCLTYQTFIDTPGGKKTVGELYEAGKPFKVYAWDRQNNKKVIAQAMAPFRKDKREPCVRITMSDGSWVETALNHRVLTTQGWRFVSDCFPDIQQTPSFSLPLTNSGSCLSTFYEKQQHLLSRLRELFSFLLQTSWGISLFGRKHFLFFSNLLESIWGIYLSTRRQDVYRLNQKQPNCQDDCRAESCLSDVPLLLDGDIDQVFVPSQDDALQHIHVWLQRDAQDCKYSDILSKLLSLLSSLDAQARFVGRNVESLFHIFYNTLKSFFPIPRTFLQPSTVGVVGFQLNHALVFHQDQDVSCSPPLCINRNKIVSVSSIGVNDCFDFTVKKYRNYIAGDLIHHNTYGVGGYELTLHLTGQYPEWWIGRRFERPVRAWAAGDTSQTVRDIIQTKLLGPPGEYGIGLIPGDLIVNTKNKAGSVPDTVESVAVKHVSGGTSHLGFKSFDQKRKSFQGTEQDVIFLDEECDLGIYAECLLRTMTTDGLVMCTFTPLLGLSETVLSFMPGGKIPEDFAETGKFVVNATWDDAPHLTEQQKADLLKSIPAYQRDARSKGIPQLGSGAIYPIAEADIIIEPFEIPPSWPRVYALDVGWRRTAALWGAWDQQSDVVYLYSEHYQSMAEPLIHAEAIKARGLWIPGVVDPASQGASQVDGKRLIDMYVEHGLNLSYADNAVETGIQKVWTRLSTGRLKVFSSLLNFFAEYRIYRRDEKGKIVKENDHLCDCCKYLIMSGLNIAMTAPPAEYELWDAQEGGYCQTDTVNETTGY